MNKQGCGLARKRHTWKYGI